MSTCVTAPTGIVESSALYPLGKGPPAHLLEKRKKMKEALIQRLAKQHGSDRVIARAVTRFHSEPSAFLLTTSNALR